MAERDHDWAFFRAGGVDQVSLRSGEDVARLANLDQKLWVALACPTKGTDIDEATLTLIDADKDGRIRPPEVLAAVEWSSQVFGSLDVLFDKGSTLELGKLNDKTDQGKAVLASAKRILKDQGKKGEKTISLDDVLAMSKVFADTRFNGDGIVPASSSDDAAIQKAIEDMLTVVPAATDRSGKPGIDRPALDKFCEQAALLIAWHDEEEKQRVAELGAATGDAANALAAVEPKIQDFFTRARLAAYDPKAAAALSASEADLVALSGAQISHAAPSVERLPLARVEAGRALSLEAGLNPAWSERVAAFAKLCVAPLSGGPKAQLSEGEFAKLVDKLAGYRAFQAKKPETVVEPLGIARLRELAAPEVKDAVVALIEKDLSLQSDYLEIASVEKAVRFKNDLLRLLRNFVSFADFYGKRGGSFQAGTLYLDARSCDLCVFVDDAGKHAPLAGLSKAYLAYCTIKRLSGEQANVVCAFTAGDVDHLMVGRNGVFYDRQGRDWDATITSIVENPLSVRQAFWSPYKRLVRLIEEQVAKRAADKEKESTAKVDAAAVEVAASDQHPPAAAGAAPAAPAAPGAVAPPAEKKIDVGMIAALGVAVAGVATFLSSVLATFLGLGMWMPLGVVALVLGISGPSMLIAWLKLRQRNLGPILDASGWAVNGRMKINVPFGGSLTKVAKLPEGSSRAADDPFAEEPTPVWRYVILAGLALLLIVWLMGKLDAWLPSSVRAGELLKPKPPASAAPSAAPAPAAPPPSAPPAK